MSIRHQWIKIISLGLMAGILVIGCRSFTPPVTYYTLTGISASEKETEFSPASSPSLVIGISAVDIPGYVNRLQIVTRSGKNQIRISGTHRWADYPDRMIKRVIAENIQALIPESRVFGAPWPTGVRPDITVSFAFIELLGTNRDEVKLSANWAVARSTPKKTVQTYQTLLTEPVSGSGFDALVAAHSRAVEKLCREVAIAISASGPETQTPLTSD